MRSPYAGDVEVAIDHPVVGAGRSIGEERVDLVERRRQAGQVEGHPPDQHLARRGRRGREPLRFEPGAHERVDGIERRGSWSPSGGVIGRDRRERPVRLVVGAFRHPSREQGLLVLAERQVRFGRRHRVFDLFSGDAANELALRRIARLDDRPAGGQLLERALAQVEPQLGLAPRRVGSVAAETAIGEQRPDLAGEVDARSVFPGRRRLFGRAEKPAG